LVSFTIRPLYLRIIASSNHWTWGLLGPRASVDDAEKYLLRLARLEPGTPSSLHTD
jgi:hypothetical protein